MGRAMASLKAKLLPVGIFFLLSMMAPVSCKPKPKHLIHDDYNGLNGLNGDYMNLNSLKAMPRDIPAIMGHGHGLGIPCYGFHCGCYGWNSWNCGRPTPKPTPKPRGDIIKIKKIQDGKNDIKINVLPCPMMRGINQMSTII